MSYHTSTITQVPYQFPKMGWDPCNKCHTRPSTVNWVMDSGALGLVHGMSELRCERCERCCVEEQLEYARKLSASIPELEAKLRELP